MSESASEPATGRIEPEPEPTAHPTPDFDLDLDLDLDLGDDPAGPITITSARNAAAAQSAWTILLLVLMALMIGWGLLFFVAWRNGIASTPSLGG